MLRDNTFGQYLPGNSLLHRLDPRMKIILTILFIVIIFMASNVLSFVALLLFTVLLLILSRLSLRVMLRSIRPVVLIILFTMVFNLFLTEGTGAPLASFWVFKLYREGIVRAVLMALRVILLIAGTAILLTYTTSPIALSDALENLLGPLKKIHVPVHEFAMMMTIALRFIPTLIEETDRIMCAQKARGADFTSGSLARRAKALIPILIPLFVSAFKRAEDLAVAMECRCYRGGEGRTKLRRLRYSVSDFVFLLSFVIFLTGIILCNHFSPINIAY